ncbi:unnamed protein product [Sphenostylis stenocarpa]|uniref:Desiccation-related protein PCC13-62 n=1 Tax=Sphenostylis stenocarpa TaxID=92480 RepID=A0AA86SHJ8_9FABA|nr:unnamed protein product [Sphenostylis stenocarpa]
MLRASSSDLGVSQTQTLISDQDQLELALNFEYLSAEFFSYGANGRGLDATAPQLTKGGPPPIGGRKANLDPLLQDIFSQFALINIAHLGAINGAVKGFPEPLLNISKEVFGEIVELKDFDVYANGLNYLLGAYISLLLLPQMLMLEWLHSCRTLNTRLVAGLLGVDSGPDAVIRAYLYERRDAPIPPYSVKVSDLTGRISDFANRLGKEGIKSEGLVVPQSEGAEGKTTGNVIAGDKDSLAFGRTASGILKIVYGTGDEHVPGAFFPNGANGFP